MIVVAILAVTGCKKADKAPPATDNSSALKPADKPVDKPVDKPPEKPPETGSGSAAATGSGSAAAAPTEPTWEKYTSKEGGFSIDLPSKPQEQVQSGMTIVGAQFGVTAADDRSAMCGVAFMALPDPKADRKVMLEASTARHKEGAKVIEEKDVKMGKFPGRSLVVENSSHRKWMRVFITDKTLYVLNCGGPFDRAESDGKIATKALDSFKLD